MSGRLKTLPSDFDIFSSSMSRCSTCIQNRDELLVGRAFALGDLVFVMRKNEIDAAAVDVDRRLAQQPQRHRRALEVPARAGRGRIRSPSSARSSAFVAFHSTKSRALSLS